LKAFTCTTHGVPGLDEMHLRELFARAASCGAVCLVHCEDELLTQSAERELREAGRDDPGIIPAWRKREAEQAALRTAARLAHETGARAVAAHASHVAALNEAAGLVVESCPQYLSLLEEEVLQHGAFRKFTPPARARDQAELDRMWQALAEGGIHYVSSD